MKKSHLHICSLILSLSLLATERNYSFAAEMEQDEKTAILFGDTIIPPTTFGRQTQLVNQVAENVTVITHEDIERLQAHSLGDVLQFYPGVIAYPYRNSNDMSVPMVQGLPNRQTLITMDGLPLNGLSDGIADIGLVPVNNLDRIEIVEGPAASVWGRSEERRVGKECRS